jgi:hypothetical protein
MSSEGLARVTIARQRARGPVGDEQVVLASFVVVQAANRACRENETFVWRIGAAKPLARRTSTNQPRSSSKRRSGRT